MRAFKHISLLLLSVIFIDGYAQNIGFKQRYSVDTTSSFVEWNTVSYYGSTVFDNSSINLFRFGGTFTDNMKSSAKNRLQTINRVGGEISTSVYYCNPNLKVYKDFGVFAAFQMTQSVGVEFTDDAYNLAFYGNQSFINDTAWLERTGFHNTGYKSMTLGINKGNRLRVGLSFLSYGYNDFATVQQGYVSTDTINQQLTANINTEYGQFSSGKPSIWNNRGNGIAVSFEWFIPLNPMKPGQMAIAGIQNFGIQWSKMTNTRVDTTYSYSGFNINSIDNLGQTIGGVDLKDTLHITQSIIRYSSLMPFQVYFYKLPDNKKVSSIYGFRYQVDSHAIPLLYAGAQIKIGERATISPYFSYGNFNKFGFGLSIQKQFEHLGISLNTKNILGVVSSKAYGKSLNFSIMYRI